MHLEILVEEPSAEATLNYLVPRIVPDVSFDVHPYSGKPDLLAKLPQRLQGYSKWLPDDWRIVVLVDEDREDCLTLKQQLEGAANKAGLVMRSSAASKQKPIQLANRIAIEELEAWFFGDVPAIVQAYPKVSPNLGKKAKYRDPDGIGGGTWEALERVLKKAGYHPGGKIEVARNISQHMDPDNNTSHSFQVFRDALRELTQEQ